MTVKSLFPLIILGSILIHKDAFSSSEELTVPGDEVTAQKATAKAPKSRFNCSWSCCKGAVEDVVETSGDILKIAAEKGAVEVTTDLLRKDYPEALKDSVSALVFALQTYKANGKNAQMALNALAAVGSVAEAKLDATDGRSINAPATAYITAALESLSVSTASDSGADAKIKSALIHITIAFVDDLKDDGVINASNKGDYIARFGELLDVFEPKESDTDLRADAIRSAIIAAKAAFFDLLNGKGDKLIIIGQIKRVIEPFHINHPQTLLDRNQEQVADIIDVVVDIAAGKNPDIQTVTEILTSDSDHK